MRHLDRSYTQVVQQKARTYRGSLTAVKYITTHVMCYIQDKDNPVIRTVS